MKIKAAQKMDGFVFFVLYCFGHLPGQDLYGLAF